MHGLREMKVHLRQTDGGRWLLEDVTDGSPGPAIVVRTVREAERALGTHLWMDPVACAEIRMRCRAKERKS